MMVMALSTAQLYLIAQDDQNEVKHDFLVMLCHWYQCLDHMMPMVAKMSPLHSLGQDNQNDIQHDFLVISCHWH